ncbi:hypothetical protein C3492_14670 [Streptomyces sp. Ru62]|uniref:hypothetical protein n=1 Tax=Streptomyces sp. Ru62 TaxID=2080745 RepID=UPI000CDD23E5|nr:hypothetical protein [Streptomyces sp. Ru62]POX62908.1 hypothetical protein C3492_14670 [Streptomyces sp. Ru62]
MSMPTHYDPLRALGPDTALLAVLSAFEKRGHDDPAAAWRALTSTWNWAAPLPTGFPGTDRTGTPAVRPVSGGYTLSGHWRLPSAADAAPWVALPLADGRRSCAGTAAERNAADLFVMPARNLRTTGMLPRGRGDSHPASGLVSRATDAYVAVDVYVPVGFATYTTGKPLFASDAAFHWTAIAALALGAARRTTDALAGSVPGAAPPHPPAAPAGQAVELAAVLHDERSSLAATVHDLPAARDVLPQAMEARLAQQVRQVAIVVQHVLTEAYQQILSGDTMGDRHDLVSIIETSSPILQQARRATEILPPVDNTPLRKG